MRKICLLAARLWPPASGRPQIELFRDTRDSLLSAHGPAALVNMTPAARERAFRQEMRAEKNLHPALAAPEGHYKASPGHCLVRSVWVHPCPL